MRLSASFGDTAQIALCEAKCLAKCQEATKDGCDTFTRFGSNKAIWLLTNKILVSKQQLTIHQRLRRAALVT